MPAPTLMLVEVIVVKLMELDEELSSVSEALPAVDPKVLEQQNQELQRQLQEKAQKEREQLEKQSAQPAPQAAPAAPAAPAK